MSTIPQSAELLKHLFSLLEIHRPVVKQQRVYERLVALCLGQVMGFARRTITQLLFTLGMNETDWSGWYRLFSAGRFDYERASEIFFIETLRHVGEDEAYVVGGDATQTPRSSRKVEGSGWLRNLRTPPFMVGIHAAQRWFNGSWLVPAENGYSRALPLRWLPCFTQKSQPQVHEPQSEGQAAVAFLRWVREQLDALGRKTQSVLMVADGSYDTLYLWQYLPERTILFARSAKNRVLCFLPDPKPTRGRPRKYGQRAPTPQQVWQGKKGWKKLEISVRGRLRHLQYKVSAPLLRKQAAHRPLLLIVVRGKQRKGYRRQPLPFLVNAVQNEADEWVLPLPIHTLLFWAWQRWELEVCHRELKSNFGLGHPQCWNPIAAVLVVQWQAWLYSLLLLAAYRTWGLCGAPDVPTRWWRGSQRWSLNTLWRAYRAALWGQHDFYALCSPTLHDWGKKEALLPLLRNAIFAAARS